MTNNYRGSMNGDYLRLLNTGSGFSIACKQCSLVYFKTKNEPLGKDKNDNKLFYPINILVCPRCESRGSQSIVVERHDYGVETF